MKKIKVIQINPSLDMGGIETMMVQLCNHLDKKQFEVVLCSLSTHIVKAKELYPDVKVVSMGYKARCLRGFYLMIFAPLVLCKLGKWLKSEQPDIVHIHAYFSMYMLIALAVKLYFKQAKIVKTLHTSAMFYSSDRLIDHFRLWVEQRATALNNTYVVGICKQVEEIANLHFSGVAQGLRMIYNGVDLSNFTHLLVDKKRNQLIGNKRVLVAYVARFVDGKNHRFLLDVWSELKKKGVDSARLLLVGDGDYLESTQREIERLNLEKEVICLGRSNEVSRLLSVCDFAVFPSDYEGFSIAMIEKMASSLPVVASDIPSFREIITQEIDGIIVPLSDRQGWKEAVEKLINDSDLRCKMGSAALNRSRDFSIELMTSEYENLYRYACSH